jgi:EmrB/QacA subfamily drug resistance transporter
MLIIVGVLVPVFMGSLDQTILASALPTIGRDLGDAQSLPWLITAYLIASTAATPLYGKVSDIHGRRFTMLIAIAFYMTGSLICALAPDMTVLILGRALHGLGGGGLQTMGIVVLGDIATPKNRAKYYAYFSIVYTTAGGLGPALGGFLSDHLHWSAIFWLNLPLGILAIMLAQTCLRRLPRHERPHRLDFIGALLIVTASVAFMLALDLGGVSYSWTSPTIMSFVAAALVLGLGFVYRLRTAPEPLIPISILRDPVARCATLASTFGWGAIIGLNIFLPMYVQSVMGLSATSAGLSLVVLMVTLNMSAGLSAPIVGWVRHYKTVPMIGLVVTIGAVGVLAWQAKTLTPFTFQVLLFTIGVGFGPLVTVVTVALQNTVPSHQFGTAVGVMNFTRMLYTTFLIAGFGAVVVPGMSSHGFELTARGQSAALSADHAAQSFTWAFFAAAASLALAAVALFLLEEKPLRTTHS